MNIYTRRKGFSIIELIVVIAVIGILATIIIILVSSARTRGRDARRERDAHEIRTALGLYASDHDDYPTSNNPYPITITGQDDISQALVSSKNISVMPTDPNGQPPNVYTYTAENNGNSYVFRYCYETTDKCRDIRP